MQIPLSQILITDRQRLEMDESHITQLMLSFQDIGQVQAVLVALRDEDEAYQVNEKALLSLLNSDTNLAFTPITEKIPVKDWPQPYRIIAGATRCTAALRLGWTHIRGDLFDQANNESSRIKAEYVENALRRDLPWQDSCLALAKLNSSIAVDKALTGEPWTQRMLALFTGYKQVQMSYMLAVADGLRVDPRDEELWNCGGFMPAFQLLLARQDVLAVQELERRKQALALIELPPEQNTFLNEDGSTEQLEGEDKLLIPTEASAPAAPVQVRIYGNVTPKAGMYSLAIVHGDSENNYETIHHALKDPGYCIVVGVLANEWSFNYNANKAQGFSVMPFPITWDKQQLSPQTAWPFVPNNTLCMLLEKKTGTTTLFPNPASSVISSFPISPNPNEQLPLALIAHLTSTLCSPGEPVLNPDCSAINALLELGHTPVWQEDDKEKYAATHERIKQWYLTNVPGCEVVE